MTQHVIVLDAPDDGDGWRRAARALWLAGVRPADVTWSVAGDMATLFASTATPLPPAAAEPGLRRPAVPRECLLLINTVLLHRDPERFALAYQLLIEIGDGRTSMGDRVHPVIARLTLLAQAVRRDIHKMRAFVRFRELTDADGPRFVAWFEPDHHIVRRNAAFFVDRFSSMRWSILTPDLSIHWDGERLTEGPGGSRGAAAGDDPIEDVWKRYYASIFNPSRVKIGAMMKEMPRKYWHNMPETALIPGLIAAAQNRSAGMIATAQAAPRTALVGEGAWAALHAEAMDCKRCHLCGPATQTVFGEGPLDAPLMIVGEQPGDQEDLAGRPFIGPAGAVLDDALRSASIDRAALYMTNAVKHFKFARRGKIRLHQSPTAGEIDVCRWWIDQERQIIRPAMLMALGASAARSLMGRAVAIEANRGVSLQTPDGTPLRVTWHPSSILRLRDDAARTQRFDELVADLQSAAAAATHGD